jgi:hypothetical protein
MFISKNEQHITLQFIKKNPTDFDTLLHLVGFFFINCTMMHGSTNVKYITLQFTEMCHKMSEFIDKCKKLWPSNTVLQNADFFLSSPAHEPILIRFTVSLFTYPLLTYKESDHSEK